MHKQMFYIFSVLISNSKYRYVQQHKQRSFGFSIIFKSEGDLADQNALGPLFSLCKFTV